jgi:outer membrane protein assembly factor BamB
VRSRYYNVVSARHTTICRGDRPTLAIVAAVVATSIVAHPAAQTRPAQVDPATRIVALDPRWTVTFESAPSASSGYDEQFAYVPLKGGHLIAIDLDRGEIKWTVPLATSLTPATGDGLVFVAGEGLITALEQRSGQTVWQTPIDSPPATPLYWDSGLLLASTEGGALAAFHAQDGRVLWQQPLGAALAASPTPAGDRLYAALRDGRIVALALETGAVVWSLPLNEAVTGVLALDDQLLIGTRGNRLYSVSLDRGRIKWNQRAGADTAGAPIADDKLIYFVAFDNVLRALDRKSGNLRWSRRLPSRPAGGPLLAGDVVLLPFVTTDIGAYTASTGAEAFTIRAVGEIGSVPFIRQSPRWTAPRLIAMSREGALQGFAPRVEPPPAPLGALPGIKTAGH